MAYNTTSPLMGGGHRSGHKRHLMETNEEEDNTFLPPALSSYSIALLNDKSKSQESTGKVMGIYELDFPDNNRFGGNLKNKLSVHFGESKKSSINSNPYYTAPPSHHEASNNSGHFTNGTAGGNSSLGHSAHNSFTHSMNNNTASEDDLMDENSPQNMSSKSYQTSATTPGDNASSLPHSSGSRNGNVHTIKRIRGPRRFGKILGPPKRASRITEEKLELQPSPIDHDRNLINTPPPTSEHSSERLFDVDSQRHNYEQFKEVKSPEISLLTKEKEDELRRRIEERKSFNELQLRISKSRQEEVHAEKSFEDKPEGHFEVKDEQFNFEKMQSDRFESIDKENRNANNFLNNNLAKASQFRQPLGNVSHSTLNKFNDFDGFRKPKIPKSYNNPTPPSQSGMDDKPENEPWNHYEQGFRDSQRNGSTPPLQQNNIVDQQDQISKPGPIFHDEQKKKKGIVINGNHYEKLELIGRGGTSKVYKVKLTSKNRLYAIKKVTFDQFDEACVKGFRGEIDLLQKLKDSDRVVKLIDHAIGEGSLYLIMECGDIDLAHVFQTRLNLNFPLDVDFVKYHAIEMFKCVKGVHEAGIVHSDLKPANFLFVRGILKIIDFGIANAVPDHTANIYRESQTGTPNYMAPEALIEVNQTFPGLPLSTQQNFPRNTWKVGKPSDVWSCGCILYQMIYGRPPYGGYSGNQRLMAIINSQVKIPYPTKGIGNVRVPQSAIELMQKCLARNPNERWTVDECLSSDFLHPKIVSEIFIRDLVHSAVNFGYNNRSSENRLITTDVYDRLVDTVLNQIENLHYG